MSGKRRSDCGQDPDFVPPSRKKFNLSRSRSAPTSRSARPSTCSPVAAVLLQSASVSDWSSSTTSRSICTSSTATSKVNMLAAAGSTHSDTVTQQCKAYTHCPGCQMPLAERMDSWCDRHVRDCLDFPSRPSQECPDGTNCSHCLPGHFRNYSHKLLASLRSGAAVPKPAPSTILATSVPSSVQTMCSVLPSTGMSSSLATSVVHIPPRSAPAVTSLSLPMPAVSRDSATRSSASVVDVIGPLPASQPNKSKKSGQQRLSHGSQPPVPLVQSKLVNFEFKIPPPPPATSASVAPQSKLKSPVYGGLGTTARRPTPSAAVSSTGASSTAFNARQQPSSGRAMAAAAADSSGASNGTGHETDGAVMSAAGGKRKRKQCPFYKWIPDTCFTVDAFCYGSVEGCKAYFLSHFHSDHYQGLNKSFSHPIYCSKSTGNLCISQLRVSPNLIQPLAMNETRNIHGVLVTPVDANHCPGSVIFIFQLPNGKTMLHTGDFRSSDSVIHNPHLRGLRYDTIYLDTTYLDPKYDFPPQDACVEFAVRKAKEALANNPKTLIVSGTYSIGKERVFLAVAEALQSKVAVSAKKKAILDQLEWPELTSRLTTNWSEAKVHVLPMMQISFKGMAAHLEQHRAQYNCIVGFRPTGWTQSNKTSVHASGSAMPEILPSFRDGMILYGIPYSEHSSFSELKRFIQHFHPRSVQPTVNVGSAESRDTMQRFFNQWLAA
eukprot:scpid37331/ scgid32737/ DNA cross-link repair 1A protein; SNM1 homolog A